MANRKGCRIVLFSYIIKAAKDFKFITVVILQKCNAGLRSLHYTRTNRTERKGTNDLIKGGTSPALARGGQHGTALTSL